MPVPQVAKNERRNGFKARQLPIAHAGSRSIASRAPSVLSQQQSHVQPASTKQEQRYTFGVEVFTQKVAIKRSKGTDLWVYDEDNMYTTRRDAITDLKFHIEGTTLMNWVLSRTKDPFLLNLEGSDNYLEHSFVAG